MSEPCTVHAGGGVIWRVVASGLEVLVAHRPKYDDWTFPKGKRDPGETDEQCALREVQEETGLDCVLGHELPSTEYLDVKGRPKTVRYWEMTVSGGSFVPNHEVDEVRWMPVPSARQILSYGRDQRVLDAFASFADGAGVGGVGGGSVAKR